VIFFCAAQLAQTPEGRLALQIQIAIIASFGVYQLARWRPWQWNRSLYPLASLAAAPVLETKVYETLGDRWYTAKNDPIALLRAESRARLPWIQKQLKTYRSDPFQKTLVDLGCGAGILTNGLASVLAKSEWRLIGIDASLPALEVARKFQPQGSATCSIEYQVGDAHFLPFEDQSIDCLCAMDFLEHIENKDRVLREIARVLKPGGLFFFHTFTTGALSRFLVIDLVEAFIPNTPRGLHIEPLFIHPDTLNQKFEDLGLKTIELLALNPQITPSALAHLLLKREIPDSFEFKIEGSEKITAGYIGFARRDSNQIE
jgi:2-polyprenyl-6-hydroxyphenyl methylase/3-demethylubiquinone-9 3-methyltransferase